MFIFKKWTDSGSEQAAHRGRSGSFDGPLTLYKDPFDHNPFEAAMEQDEASRDISLLIPEFKDSVDDQSTNATQAQTERDIISELDQSDIENGILNNSNTSSSKFDSFIAAMENVFSGIGDALTVSTTEANRIARENAAAAMQYNRDEAAADRAWQEYMSSTAYQRAVSDMKAAGLNPMLGYTQGGASTPGGASASTSAANTYKDSGFAEKGRVAVALVSLIFKGLTSALSLTLKK